MRKLTALFIISILTTIVSLFLYYHKSKSKHIEVLQVDSLHSEIPRYDNDCNCPYKANPDIYYVRASTPKIIIPPTITTRYNVDTIIDSTGCNCPHSYIDSLGKLWGRDRKSKIKDTNYYYHPTIK